MCERMIALPLLAVMAGSKSSLHILAGSLPRPFPLTDEVISIADELFVC